MAATSLPGGESGMQPPSMGSASQVNSYMKYNKRNKGRNKKRGGGGSSGGGSSAGRALLQRTLSRGSGRN